MLLPHPAGSGPITRMADGTIKQVSPLTGTEVWTVPGRAHRPLGVAAADPAPLDPAAHGRHCAFCHLRYLDTPPEKSRLVRSGTTWETLRELPADQLGRTVAELRRIPNLFEILSLDYWQVNYGYEVPEAVTARARAYLADETGREHVLAVLRARLLAGGLTPAQWDALGTDERLAHAGGLFGGGHDVVVARRHFVDGATHDDQLAASGTLTPEEHHRYTAFTVEAMRSLYAANRYVRYVAVFQNWLRPAGASFDHLHKQLVAIDERGRQTEMELERLRTNPNLYNEVAVNYAGYANLVVAENDHAVAFAGFGHRYPTLEVYSKSPRSEPWEQTEEEVRGMSDLLHACHAATGTPVPTNEEWHHRPADVDVAMPWRVMLKWRVSTLAGFEGGTKINLNTIDPYSLRDMVVPRLYALRDAGAVAPVRIATECPCRPNPLRYRANRG